MLRIKVEDVIGQLETQIQASLREAVKEVAPDARFNERDLYIAFKRAVGRKCKRWERISDRYVEFE